MRESPFPAMECPVARSLAEVGDAWRVLILRDALLGFRRFDEFEMNLGIAPNILTQRLNGLVSDGLLVKREYQQRPVRHEYVPTTKARDFTMVIAALAAWGTRWLNDGDPTVSLVDRKSGESLEPSMIGSGTRRSCAVNDIQFKPGPNAGPETLQRAARLRLRLEK